MTQQCKSTIPGFCSLFLFFYFFFFFLYFLFSFSPSSYFSSVSPILYYLSSLPKIRTFLRKDARDIQEKTGRTHIYMRLCICMCVCARKSCGRVNRKKGGSSRSKRREKCFLVILRYTYFKSIASRLLMSLGVCQWHKGERGGRGGLVTGRKASEKNFLLMQE